MITVITNGLQYLVVVALMLFASSGVSESRADDLDTTTVANILSDVSASDQRSLPKPSRYDPLFWGLPDYARTSYDCKGDITFADFLESKFADQPRGRLNIHYITSGFSSITLGAEDENAIDVVSLTPTQVDALRAILKRRVEYITDSANFGGYVIDITGTMTGISLDISVVGVIAAALKRYGLPISLFIIGESLGKLKDKVTTSTVAPLQTLADRMLTDVKVYRHVSVIKSAEGLEYVRYLFAVKLGGFDLLVLRNCVYARH